MPLLLQETGGKNLPASRKIPRQQSDSNEDNFPEA